MQTQPSRFRIVREDLAVDPVTLVTDGLKIGRLPNCEVVLNHPTVSRLHAGITQAEGRFYLYNFSQSSGTTLNGRSVATDSGEELVDGDVVQVGPFFLTVGRMGDALSITVALGFTGTAADADSRIETPTAPSPFKRIGASQSAEMAGLAQALNVFWEKRKREAGKMQRVSPLRPHKPAHVLGKARFNWTPTRDLVRPWPFSIFVWGVGVVVALSVVAAYVYAESFAPAPVSAGHAAASIHTQPPIAQRSNANSCTNCHALKTDMQTNCAACHTAAGFRATVTEPHRAAGIRCMDCHVEHQGTEYRPATSSLQTCVSCHSDANKKTYNGRAVSTPHGGTLGYPVVEHKWRWMGLTDEEWQQKSAAVQKLVQTIRGSLLTEPDAAGREPDDVRRSSEFHALHLHRVKALPGMPANKDGEMSCSSCHKSFSPIDRETPRQTCADCHNGDRGGKFEKILAADRPNCISCHVQHPLARREWGRALLNDLSAAAPDFSHTP